ncbi:hypothetical protein B0H14DRAFT_3897614 [Mycena olivaceomarginata]|nr:hypothetical protein B0H14DRAFT_3897614 [Mycena olivaceomarginata]
MNLEGAAEKLERVVKEMEFLSGTTRADARKAAPRRKSKQKTQPAKDVPSVLPADAAKDAMYDRLYDAIMPSSIRNGNSNYRPRKPNANLSEEEDNDFVDEENEPTVSKRKIFVVDGVAAVPPPKKKKQKTKSAPAAPPPTVEVIDVDIESEDENLQTGGKRGPKSESRDHYWPPVATTKTGGNKRWSFTCRHCKIAVTFKRTVGKTQLFGDESPAPNLGNLSTHLKQQHDGVPVPSDVRPGETRGISTSSAKIMADFLVDGKLNPAINSTQGNFYKIFAAWIIEDDLAFTTGETPGIERLFAFLRARFL